MKVDLEDFVVMPTITMFNLWNLKHFIGKFYYYVVLVW